MHALLIASLISLALAVAKGSAFAMSGSVIVLASFLDSFMDAILSWVNFKFSRAALARADRQHPYGHGGLEVISTLLQGILIAGSGGLVIFQTLDRIFSPVGIQNTDLAEIPTALAIMVASSVAGFGISKMLQMSKQQNAAQQLRSLSLDADHAHYLSDALQNGVGVLGMLLTIWQQNPAYDVVFGGICGLILLKTAYPLIRNSLRDIMNTEFDQELQNKVQSIVANCGYSEVKGMHRLRSRTLGPVHFVDFHLKLPNDITLIEAHRIADRLETKIRMALPRADVMIHLDPEDEPDDDL